MVRLKGSEVNSLLTNISFQFQNGSIKREQALEKQREEFEFQFQNGSIKRWNG